MTIKKPFQNRRRRMGRFLVPLATCLPVLLPVVARLDKPAVAPEGFETAKE
jgi:hypothetical protein